HLDLAQAAFEEFGEGLQFKREDLEQGCIQFFDLKVYLNDGLCWQFSQRSQKDLLPFASHHSKTVKEGIVKNLLNASFEKSCCHMTRASLAYQAGRSEEHTSELQSRENLVCRLLLEK